MLLIKPRVQLIDRPVRVVNRDPDPPVQRSHVEHRKEAAALGGLVIVIAELEHADPLPIDSPDLRNLQRPINRATGNSASSDLNLDDQIRRRPTDQVELTLRIAHRPAHNVLALVRLKPLSYIFAPPGEAPA